MLNKLPHNSDTFENQTFIDLDLIEGFLENRSFKNCTFKNCKFTQCTFEKCEFNYCTFEKCDLSVIKFKKSQYNNLVFKNCKAIGIQWGEKMRFKLRIEFYKCMINLSVFSNIVLKDFKLIDCTAFEVDFLDVQMKDAVCTGTNFQGSLFGKVNLTKADLRNAKNYKIDPTNCIIKQAKFSYPDALSLLSIFEIEVDGI